MKQCPRKIMSNVRFLLNEKLWIKCLPLIYPSQKHHYMHELVQVLVSKKKSVNLIRIQLTKHHNFQSLLFIPLHTDMYLYMPFMWSWSVILVWSYVLINFNRYQFKTCTAGQHSSHEWCARNSQRSLKLLPHLAQLSTDCYTDSHF